jgi:hypothetical protein
MITEAPRLLLLAGWMLGNVSVDIDTLIAEAPQVLLLVVPLSILIYVAIAARRRLRRKANRFGYGGILEYLRAVTAVLPGTGADDPSGEGAPRNPLNIETFSHHGIQASQTPIPFREGGDP